MAGDGVSLLKNGFTRHVLSDDDLAMLPEVLLPSGVGLTMVVISPCLDMLFTEGSVLPVLLAVAAAAAAAAAVTPAAATVATSLFTIV